jgi:hypothetical protein
MIPRRVFASVTVVLASIGTAFADSPPAVYVTNGNSGQVLAIPLDPATGVQNGPIQTLVSSGAELSDVTLKSDGILYYATASDIRRVGSGSPVAAVAGVKELRFSAYNCLFYNNAAGANSVGCGNSSSPAGAGGSGVAFDLFGRLLAISGSTVIRIPLDAAGNKGTPTTLVSGGLVAPTSIAVAWGEGANSLERGDFVVIDGRFARLYDGKTGALKNAQYAAVPKWQTINHADFDADDRLWMTTMTLGGGTRDPNGRVFHADAGGAVCADTGGSNCTLAAMLPQDPTNLKYPPAVGLALAPSGRLLTRSIAPAVPNVEQEFAFDFGASIVRIHAVAIDSCALRVRASAVLAPDATALVNDSQYSLNPYLGEEGLPTVYHIETIKNGTPVSANACVQVSSTSKPFVFIAALTSTEVNPRILRCESGCSEIELFGWWHTGPIDGDAAGGGTTDDWSDWLIVEKALQPAGERVQFCGIGPPLRTDSIAVFNPGSNLTVKAQFSLPGQPCGNGMFLTDPNARFLISLARVSPTYENKRLVDDSGNSGEPPLLGQAGKSYDFELSLNEPNGDDYADGIYEITLTDVTPGGTRLQSPATIYFRIGKK